jgi:hypothetical protein
MVPRRLSAVCLPLLVVLLAGCGATGGQSSAKKFSGVQKDVATTIDGLQSAGRKGDGAQICSRYLATTLVDQIKAHGRRTCESTLKQALKDVDAFDLEVVDRGITLGADGKSATAKVKSRAGTGSRLDTLTLVLEPQTSGGKTTQVWKLSALAR